MRTINQFSQSGGFLERSTEKVQVSGLDDAVNALLQSAAVDGKTADTICSGSQEATTIANSRSGTSQTTFDLFDQRNRKE